ncbi:MAG: GerMN domain-containing protein [Leptospiraceae bacterium]|nr:GerMN domain-containing protein [Leptospiraceae bacterium]
MNRGAGGQGPASPVEAENRAILILGGILLLLVFLDRQASDQMSLRSRAPDVTRPAALIQEKIETGVGETAEQLQGVRESLEGRAEDGLQSGKNSLEQRLAPVKKPIDEILNSRMQDPSQKIVPEQLQSETRVSLPQGAQDYHLYFLRFNGNHSQIVRVSRAAKKPITYLALLQDLQDGPREQETGLLTAVDHSIKFNGVSESDGVVTVDLGNSIHRMGSAVIRDRIHQICLTLFQFSSVKAVRILVDGKKPEYLGSGKDRLKLPEYLGYPDRKIQVYTNS